MPTADDIAWFKRQFHQPVAAALAGTPFDLDMITAIACQETGHVWALLRRKGLPTKTILALCVGDTLDADKGRRAFPQTKADLIAAPRGQEMFDIARTALLAMAEHIPGFDFAKTRPNKFCHGFGVFQRDLQFFLTDPDYFLNRDYERFDATLAHCLDELGRGLRKLGLQGRTALSDMEFCAVAIAYNTGGFKPALGLKQGHRNAAGRFYGEQILDFLRLARTVALPKQAPAIAPPAENQAILPPPTPVAAEGPAFVVNTQIDPLRVRSEPRRSEPELANVRARLPDGHPVRAVTGKVIHGFIEIETSLAGAHITGFVAAKFLRPVAEPAPIPMPAAPAEPPPPPSAAPANRITAVLMPRNPGTLTRRTNPAGAHSLNEPNQPARGGSTAAELVASIDAIIDHLAVDRATHARYQPRAGLTFCNIYAHDFCHLAGVYLPRVWWTPGAIRDLAQGRTVEPRIASTIEEMRANALFRWLRDFGPDFGWRQTGTLDKLQQAANQGAVGLIVARRKEEGRSGHIVVVAPESGGSSARRNSAGEVTAPLQSQAGATNFRRGTGRPTWWMGAEFAESAFWVHA